MLNAQDWLVFIDGRTQANDVKLKLKLPGQALLPLPNKATKTSNNKTESEDTADIH